jgi:hypothetical protein
MDETYSTVISEKELLTKTYGIILARIFLGNYAKQNHPGNRGRGWSDADLALWLNWIRAGLPGEEWHVYYGKLIKSF